MTSPQSPLSTIIRLLLLVAAGAGVFTITQGVNSLATDTTEQEVADTSTTADSSESADADVSEPEYIVKATPESIRFAIKVGWLGKYLYPTAPDNSLEESVFFWKGAAQTSFPIELQPEPDDTEPDKEPQRDFSVAWYPTRNFGELFTLAFKELEETDLCEHGRNVIEAGSRAQCRSLLITPSMGMRLPIGKHETKLLITSYESTPAEIPIEILVGRPMFVLVISILAGILATSLYLYLRNQGLYETKWYEYQQSYIDWIAKKDEWAKPPEESGWGDLSGKLTEILSQSLEKSQTELVEKSFADAWPTVQSLYWGAERLKVISESIRRVYLEADEASEPPKTAVKKLLQESYAELPKSLNMAEAKLEEAKATLRGDPKSISLYGLFIEDKAVNRVPQSGGDLPQVPAPINTGAVERLGLLFGVIFWVLLIGVIMEVLIRIFSSEFNWQFTVIGLPLWLAITLLVVFRLLATIINIQAVKAEDRSPFGRRLIAFLDAISNWKPIKKFLSLFARKSDKSFMEWLARRFRKGLPIVSILVSLAIALAVILAAQTALKSDFDTWGSNFDIIIAFAWGAAAHSLLQGLQSFQSGLDDFVSGKKPESSS